MQHLAMKVGSEEELLALRDRLRTNGVVVMGPIDHGMCRSLYFAGPEGLTLEAAWSGAPLDPDRWIDPEVCEAAGITPDDVARCRSPAPFPPPAAPVPQTPIAPAQPHH